MHMHYMKCINACGWRQNINYIISYVYRYVASNYNYTAAYLHQDGHKNYVLIDLPN